MIIVLQVCFIHPGMLSPEKRTGKCTALRSQYGRRFFSPYLENEKTMDSVVRKNVEALNLASLLITFTLKDCSRRKIRDFMGNVLEHGSIYTFNMCEGLHAIALIG